MGQSLFTHRKRTYAMLLAGLLALFCLYFSMLTNIIDQNKFNRGRESPRTAQFR